MSSGDIHVVPHDKGWAVEMEGTSRPISLHDKKGEAEKAGRDAAKRNASELLIHRRDGKITKRYTYKKDPHPPAG
jgi:hypothetical protein